eukprot:TRINITY_DN6588_c0_g1_i1.p1 TRINITY_DN6588_c0_g1~~TRINITY_DN6588_c0_g1_i1.p1  ORF type:complete len:228 (-),score=45.28 TRINITY_DN6588_c0_g1_i1:57-740(-)
METDITCCCCCWRTEAKTLAMRLMYFDVFTVIVRVAIFIFFYIDPLELMIPSDGDVIRFYTIILTGAIAGLGLIELILVVLTIRIIKKNEYGSIANGYIMLRSFHLVIFILLALGYCGLAGMYQSSINMYLRKNYNVSKADANKIGDNIINHFIVGVVSLLLALLNINFNTKLKKCLFFFERGIYSEIENIIALKQDNPKLEGSNRTHVPITQMHIVQEKNLSLIHI